MTLAWSYGSTTLATYGKVTMINDYLDIPQRRGDNQVIPYRHGTIFVPKYYDERKMTFGMAITAATATALETVFDAMRAKFAPLTEQTLSCTREDSTVRTAQATVDEPIEVDRKTNTLAFVTVTFRLANPIFRLSTVIADNTTTIDSSPHAMTVTNPGTVQERDPVITIDGPFSSITITNSTNGVALTYTGAIGASENVVIQTVSGEYTAVLSAGSANVIGNVTHSGASALMVFEVGANTLAITSAGGDNTGTVKASFYAPFL
jgi:hypothetical protein